MAHDAFISFSHKDESTAVAVRDALEAKGIRCWFAPRDILPSMSWADAIADAIDASQLLIVIFSSHSNQSQYVKQEVGFAVDGNIPITQFRIDTAKPTGAMRFHLGSRHWLDASTAPLEGHLERLARDVKQLFPALGARDGESGGQPAKPITPPPTMTNAKDGAEMIYIPAGEFIMGSDDGVVNAKSARTVSLEGYYIAKTPVTVAQYKKFCTATSRAMPKAPSWGWDHADYPMVNVTWDDAQAYAKWAGCSLPTEEQWEKAARGTDGRQFPWGNDWDPAKCQCSRKKFGDAGSPSPVGRFPTGASPYGVLDMAGNVWEWCFDLYENTTNRVVRGGCWLYDFVDYFRCACRGSSTYQEAGTTMPVFVACFVWAPNPQPLNP